MARFFRARVCFSIFIFYPVGVCVAALGYLARILVGVAEIALCGQIAAVRGGYRDLSAFAETVVFYPHFADCFVAAADRGDIYRGAETLRESIVRYLHGRRQSDRGTFAARADYRAAVYRFERTLFYLHSARRRKCETVGGGTVQYGIAAGNVRRVERGVFQYAAGAVRRHGRVETQNAGRLVV